MNDDQTPPVEKPTPESRLERQMPRRDWRHLRDELEAVRPAREWPRIVGSGAFGIAVASSFAAITEWQRRVGGERTLSWAWLQPTYVALIVGSMVVLAICATVLIQHKDDFTADVRGCIRRMDEIDAMYPSFGTTSRLPSEPRELQILLATYGANGENWDVTETVREHVSNDSLDMAVGNHMFNAGRGSDDPAYGHLKQLTILFEVNGERDTAIVDEGERAKLP